MTSHSDEPTIRLEDAAAHFITLETYRQLDTSLAAHQPDTVRQLTFADLLAAATNPEIHAETITKINGHLYPAIPSRRRQRADGQKNWRAVRSRTKSIITP